MERQFLSAFLRLRRLAVDKNPEIAFLISTKKSKSSLSDLLFLEEQDALRVPARFGELARSRRLSPARVNPKFLL